jgi:hypothetical protein
MLLHIAKHTMPCTPQLALRQMRVPGAYVRTQYHGRFNSTLKSTFTRRRSLASAGFESAALRVLFWEYLDLVAGEPRRGKYILFAAHIVMERESLGVSVFFLPLCSCSACNS